MSNKRYVVKLSLKKLMEQLDEKKFIRCHRSAVGNLIHIDSIDLKENKISLVNNTNLDIGSKYRNSIKSAFYGQ